MTLEELYTQAWADNVFFAEYAGMPAAAGDVRDLVYLAETAEPPRDPGDLLDEFMGSFMGAIVDLCVLGSVKGDDRVANCQSAWDAFKARRDAGYFPRSVALRKELGLPTGEGKALGTF